MGNRILRVKTETPNPDKYNQNLQDGFGKNWSTSKPVEIEFG